MVRHTLKNLAANAARFLKFVWPFWDVIGTFDHFGTKSDRTRFLKKKSQRVRKTQKDPKNGPNMKFRGFSK